MQFTIKSYQTGKAVWTGEIAAEFESERPGVQLGAAVKVANLAGANLAGADLTGANLTRADLTDAYLARADLADANLTRANLVGANLTGANLADADLTGANLTRANLTRADLTRADLAGANIIDAGQETRGYRYWSWRHKDGRVVYCAGCREWASYEDARAHFGNDYASTGDREECLARLALLHNEAKRRGWIKGETE